MQSSAISVATPNCLSASSGARKMALVQNGSWVQDPSATGLADHPRTPQEQPEVKKVKPTTLMNSQ